MKARNLFSKVLSFALVAVMLLGMLPMSAFAAEAVPSVVDSSKVTNGMYMNKYTTLEDDGTYTITLEAFATGTTTTSTVTKGLPLDIVIVVDQSGSMYNHVTNLRTAVDSFIDNIAANAVENEVDHRIAIVGFASNSDDGRSDNSIISSGSSTSSWINTGLYVDGTMENYNELTTTHYQNALVSVVDEAGTTNAGLLTSASKLAASGATRTSYGMEMAVNVFANNSIEGTERNRIVVMFTDGEPGRTGFATSEANSAIASAYTLKNTYGATVYTVGFFSSTPSDNVNTFMNHVSSNYPTAQSMETVIYSYSKVEEPVADTNYYYNNNGTYATAYYCEGSDSSWNSCDGGWYTQSHGGWNGHRGTKITGDLYERIETDVLPAATKYYMTTSSSSELENIFSTISNDVVNSNTSVTLDSTSVMKDIVEPDSFDIPEGYNADSQIAVFTENVTATDTDGVVTYTRDGVQVPYEATVNVDVDSNMIQVTNFDYAANFVAPAHDGEMIIVKITGIHVTDVGFAAANDNGMTDSNAEGSGIYSADGSAVFPFCKPQVKVGNMSYVLDYAKSFEMDIADWELNTVNHLALNTGKIDVTNLVTAGIDLPNGIVELVNGKYLYTPQTMSWNGYDTFYAFGKGNIGEDIVNVWSKINVIPANNVYYEDSFVTEEGENGASTVGIEYGEGWSVETSNSDANSETINHPVQGGWANEDLADDAGFSDGSAHVAQNGAKVNFTFTGTGVDVYSYTDIHSGAVRARLFSVDAEGAEKLSKVLFIDNVAESGAYYNVPTLSFSDLAYGTYKLELYVYELDALGEAEGKRSTYYLDGIRIYNPLGTGAEDPVADETVKDAYENELNAVFTEVRDILIDATNAGEGATELDGFVFIDNQEIEGEADGVATNVIATYEDYGPKNEVYLAKGQKIGFKVNGNTTDNCYYIGLKAPADASSVKITNGEGTATINITHSTDLYYELIPSPDNYVVIENTGDALISITKLRTTSATAALEDAVAAANVDELLAYVDSFSTLPEVAYGYAPEAPETDVEEPVEPSEPEVDVEIENPEEPEDENAAIKEQIQQVRDMIKKMFDAFRGWLGR